MMEPTACSVFSVLINQCLSLGKLILFLFSFPEYSFLFTLSEKLTVGSFSPNWIFGASERNTVRKEAYQTGKQWLSHFQNSLPPSVPLVYFLNLPQGYIWEFLYFLSKDGVTIGSFPPKIRKPSKSN